MKFVTVALRAFVYTHDDGEPEKGQKGEPGFLKLRLTASDNETPKETLERLSRIIEEKANLVDIGDCT